MENWINENLAIYHTYHADSNAMFLEAAKAAYVEENDTLVLLYEDSIASMSKKREHKKYFTFPPEHISYYKKYGGAPFNDMLYTVFGEVVNGMSVVDSIALSKTDENERPLADVLITTMRIIE